MNVFSHPKWLDPCIYSYNTVEEIPQKIYDDINARLDALISKDPIVSIVIPAFNEEKNILGCIDSLSRTTTKIPFEIIVVDNNSTDNTLSMLKKLHVKSLLETRKGPGPARQQGMEAAKGKYILTADSDCFYPPKWIDILYKNLQKPGVVLVYGTFSFIESPTVARYKLFMYEFLRNIMTEIRHVKRPFLNTFMINTGYVRELGMKIGFDLRNVRGEDGRMSFDMSQHGKLGKVRDSEARAWTWQRTINQDGSLNQSLMKRVIKEVTKLSEYFTKLPPHDTKSSIN